MTFRLLLLAFLLWSGFAQAATRIAIIDLIHREGLEPLLVTELSKQPAVAVIERTELARLLEEKQLAELAGARKLAGLGALLHADGLLVLEKLVLPGNPPHPVETARLVSVRHGACLAFGPIADAEGKLALPEWTAGFARKVGQVAPSLAIDQAEAVPVSVLNVRAAFLTPELVTLESALTRLLEMRLGTLPNVVLLERRRLGDAAFERSLEAADLPPLWTGAVLIDGSFETPAGAAGRVEISLRLRHQDGSKVGAATVFGPGDGVAALADSMAKAAAGLLPKTAGRPIAARKTEPAEFFAEAVWAWENGTLAAAEEALAAARALGESSPDAAALEAWLLTARAAPDRQLRLRPPQERRDPLALAEQRVLFEQALHALAEFRAAGSRLQKIGGNSAFALRDGDLRHFVIEPASEFLRANDESPAPLDVSALRRSVHDAAGMQSTGSALPYSPRTGLRFANVWAADRAELLAFFEKLIRANHFYPTSREATLGPRFRQEPGATEAWNAMVERLMKDPVTRLRALLIFSGEAETPAEEAQYHEFLRELGAQAPELYVHQQLDPLLHADGAGRPQHTHFEPERFALTLRLCETLPGFSQEMYQVFDRLRIPAGQEAKLWAAVTAYRERCLSAVPEERPGPIIQTFAFWQSRLLLNNPRIETGQGANGLLVHRFWHPYALAGLGITNHAFNEMIVAGSSVWNIPLKPADTVLEIALPDLRTTVHEVKGADIGARLAITPEALWMQYGKYVGEEKKLAMALLRHDRKSGADRVYPIPRFGVRFNVVNGRMFILFGQGPDAGLAELDQETGEFRVLVSTRRRPAQSPFDAQQEWTAYQVIAGPGGAPCVVVGSPNGGLYQVGEPWKRLAALQWPNTVSYGEKSLLIGMAGQSMLVDPARPQPLWWMAGPQSPPEIREQVPWDVPANFKDGGGSALRAFRDGEVFSIERTVEGVHRLRWWFKGSPREGVLIELRFELPEADRAVIEPLKANFRGFTTYEALLNPNHGMIGLQMQSSPEGLILTSRQHGFWFLPYADLESYVAGSSAPK